MYFSVAKFFWPYVLPSLEHCQMPTLTLGAYLTCSHPNATLLKVMTAIWEVWVGIKTSASLKLLWFVALSLFSLFTHLPNKCLHNTTSQVAATIDFSCWFFFLIVYNAVHQLLYAPPRMNECFSLNCETDFIHCSTEKHHEKYASLIKCGVNILRSHAEIHI